MTPYYQDSHVTIYNADSRDVLPTLEPVDLVLTDPPYGVGMKTGARHHDGKWTSRWHGTEITGDEDHFVAR